MRVLVPGSFDILHHGHIAFLNRCAQVGTVVVALGGDEYQEGYKRRPIQPYDLRKATLELLGFTVAERTQLPMGEMTPPPSSFDFIARGDDWRDNDSFLTACGLDWDYLHCHDVGLLIVPNQGRTSTTAIIDACRAA